ncbi:zinc-binding protein [Aquimixticola soesokkakensis]|uniref:DNA gyrase inhibitor YacG n=1 Tax=Aquimixticola soesokkakensis TaxID=1519096 RepID=A0A1Y5TEZ2_9RHOB|nr:DNA gyrase inhibitor YacG [Aquimixticola soesokkakensis]SLN60388.1 zinc-binding protein [Aquimixticola soesokkakensis]
MSCPICQKETDASYRPFCSKKCADIDLARWFNGGYAVPSAREEDPDEVQRALLEALEAEAEERAADGAKKPH